MIRWQSFNINHMIRVKLTARGKRLLQMHRPICSATLRVDADGWSEWQLWELMQTFGEHCVMGLEPPFETTIEFSIKEHTATNDS
jgi:hypothetical protein